MSSMLGILMWLKRSVQQVTKFQLRCCFGLEVFLAWRLGGVMPQYPGWKKKPGHVLYFISRNKHLWFPVHCPLLRSDASSGRPCDIYLPPVVSLEGEITRSKQWLATASIKYRVAHRRDGPVFQLLLCSRIRLCVSGASIDVTIVLNVFFTYRIQAHHQVSSRVL